MADPNEVFEQYLHGFTRDQVRVKEAWNLIDRMVPYIKLLTEFDLLYEHQEAVPLLLKEIEEKRKPHG
jgi:hypothetical protein